MRPRSACSPVMRRMASAIGSRSLLYPSELRSSARSLPRARGWQDPSPSGIPTRERRSPIRQATPWIVAEYGVRTTASRLDTSLRLAAHEDHKIRPLAGLRAQRLVLNDPGGTRGRHPLDTIQCVLWN